MRPLSSSKPVIVPALVLIVCAVIGSAALSASSAASNAETLAWSAHANFLLAAAGCGLVVLVMVVAVLTIRRETRRSRELSDALLEQKDLIQIFTDGVEHSAVFLLDPGGRIRNWNAGAERLHGHKAREIIGRPYACLYPKDDIQGQRAETGITMAEAEGRHESTAVWSVGTGRPSTPIRSSGP